MTRALLSVYELDREALSRFSSSLREALAADDRAAVARLLGLGEQLAARLGEAERAVDVFLAPEDDERIAPLFASLRRVAKKTALSLAWKSEAASLEGRLRAYDVLRDEPEIAASLDRLLDARRLPWFLRRPGATCGFLDAQEREDLARALRDLSDALPDEVVAFAEALDDADGAVLIHDAL